MEEIKEFLYSILPADLSVRVIHLKCRHQKWNRQGDRDHS